MFLFSCTFVELVRLFLFFGVRSFPCLFVHPHFNSWGIDYYLFLSLSPPLPSVSIDPIACYYFQLTNCRPDTWTRKRFTSALTREIVVAGKQTCRRFVRRPAGRVQPHFLAGGSLGRASRKYSLGMDNWRSVPLKRLLAGWKLRKNRGWNWLGSINQLRLNPSLHICMYMYTRWMDHLFFQTRIESRRDRLR